MYAPTHIARDLAMGSMSHLVDAMVAAGFLTPERAVELGVGDTP